MKKIIIILITILSLSACSKSKKALFMPDSTRWTDQDVPLNELDTGNVNTDSVAISDKMRRLFSKSDSLIEGRPVSFYLDRADVSPVAKNFYLLRFVPSDDNPTSALIDSLMTKNDTTRPFYYFLYLRLHQIADGAMAEMLPDVALAYSMDFVDEFYKKLQLPQYKSTYEMWMLNVSYMEWNELAKGQDSASDATVIKQDIISTQTKNAKHLTPSLKKQIEKFADDVAKNPNDGR